MVIVWSRGEMEGNDVVPDSALGRLKQQAKIRRQPRPGVGASPWTASDELWDRLEAAAHIRVPRLCAIRSAPL